MKDLFEKLFASVPLTVLIFSVIFLTLGAIGGIPWDTPIQAVDSSGRTVFFIVGGILFLVSLILVMGLPNSRKIPNALCGIGNQYIRVK